MKAWSLKWAHWLSLCVCVCAHIRACALAQQPLLQCDGSQCGGSHGDRASSTWARTSPSIKLTLVDAHRYVQPGLLLPSSPFSDVHKHCRDYPSNHILSPLDPFVLSRSNVNNNDDKHSVYGRPWMFFRTEDCSTFKYVSDSLCVLFSMAS